MASHVALAGVFAVAATIFIASLFGLEHAPSKPMVAERLKTFAQRLEGQKIYAYKEEGESEYLIKDGEIVTVGVSEINDAAKSALLTVSIKFDYIRNFVNEFGLKRDEPLSGQRAAIKLRAMWDEDNQVLVLHREDLDWDGHPKEHVETHDCPRTAWNALRERLESFGARVE